MKTIKTNNTRPIQTCTKPINSSKNKLTNKKQIENRNNTTKTNETRPIKRNKP